MTKIPLNIFQTYHTLDLPIRMKKCVNKLIRKNPEFHHYLYDDVMCRNFIQEYFSHEVLYAFDKLIPGAYKADLWRYCVLYIYGGIYLDIKYGCVGDFKLIELTDKEYYVKDQIMSGIQGVYQALMIHEPRNNLLLNMINHIVSNVKNNYYGSNPLMITGPHLMKEFVPNNIFDSSKLYLNSNKRCILFNEIPILRIYKGYRSELSQTQLKPPYYVLWKNRQVYNR